MTEPLNAPAAAPAPDLSIGEPLVALSAAVHAAMEEGAWHGLEGVLLASHVADRLHEANWVHQPVIRTAEEFLALPDGTTIRTVRRQGRGSHFFQRVGREFVELDPSDRSDGEETVSAQGILNWYSTGFAEVVDVPTIDAPRAEAQVAQ
jgi:hypothetical protein